MKGFLFIYQVHGLFILITGAYIGSRNDTGLERNDDKEGELDSL